MTTIIRTEKVTKSFAGQKVLSDVSIDFKAGEITGLLGPNGTGKTTLIRLLNGVIKPDSGRISIKGFDPAQKGDDIRKIAGIVTESAGLYHQMSGEENLSFFAGLYGVTGSARIDELLGLFDLEDSRKKHVGKYSTGMKKRLALAKALLHRPEILFLDEPTNGLDPDGINMVLSYLKKYNKETGTTMVICSHVLHQLETICDRFAFMEKGSIIEQGSLDSLGTRYLESIEVQLDTSFLPEKQEFLGFPFRVAGKDKLTFVLPSKKEIPLLLREVLATDPVYAVTILNRNLEAIYFKVREKNGKVIKQGTYQERH